MRPQFRVIFTVSLGKSWLWAQSKAGIRSVAPFFMMAAAASEPELSTVLRQIGRHTGPQTRPDAKSHWKAHARCLCLRRPAPYQWVDRRIGLEGVFPSVVIDWSCLSALRIGANRRRTDWRALSPAFAQEGNLFTIQTSTRRKRALNVWGFNSCGAFGNKHGGKNTGELHPDQIKGAVDRNYRIANRWRACRADNRRRCGSRAPH